MTEHKEFMKERFRDIRKYVKKHGPVKPEQVQAEFKLGKRTVALALRYMTDYGLLMRLPDFEDLRSQYYDLPNTESERDALAFIESIIEV
ncbi:hypothetical protein LCGC14_0267620 [marine sediment metagenome]|uniref:HTH dtxR-type domain-containing protein n=1 Tax=marine sediment metagenome TaxID=412755 RepID=A0A0F9WKP2_9ZZZZ